MDAEQDRDHEPPMKRARREESPVAPDEDGRPGPQDAWIFARGGELGRLMMEFDWRQSAIGPVRGWSAPLKAVVHSVLSSSYATVFFWNVEHYSMIYNDKYREILDHHHPCIGRPFPEVYPEAWPILSKELYPVFREDRSFSWQDMELSLIRADGHSLGERYFTYNAQPVRFDDSRPAPGCLVIATETTASVVNQRHLATLHKLAAHALLAGSTREASDTIVNSLAENGKDFPMAAMYLLQPTSRTFVRSAVAGLPDDCGVLPAGVAIDRRSDTADAADASGDALESAVRRAATSGDVINIPAPGEFPPIGHWKDKPQHVLALPMKLVNSDVPVAVLLVAVNTRCSLEDMAFSFYRLVAQQAAATLANARSREEAVAKANALAEIDRAKTIFFSNISHEFRTPLTLMIGPLADVLERAQLPASVKEDLTVVHRNSLRLLRLANTLLDFSRIEAGRIEACYQNVDLPLFTAELCSLFRSSCERHGLELNVSCPPLPPEVTTYVDPELWEKIVFNLLSNAFKYTHKGHIDVSVSYIPDARSVELSVADTGVGIRAEHMPRLFERFFRSDPEAGRNIEGTGIGLALVHELTKLHGGAVHAESEVGKGARFRVRLPEGRAHLPADHVRMALATSPQPTSKRDEHLMQIDYWVGDALGGSGSPLRISRGQSAADRGGPTPLKPLVLLVDDNGDMRDYVRRVLETKYDVDVAVDGLQALELVAQHQPDVIVSDVMMPRLDGFQMLQRLRSQKHTSLVPVIFLSARAGEEARIEGFEAGVDDYLVKPFTARELMARVAAVLTMSRIRLASEKKDQLLATLSHELRTPLTPAVMTVDMLRADASLPASVRSDLASVASSIQLQLRLVDDLLDHTRIARGKLHMDPQATDINELLQQALLIVKSDVDAKNISVRTTLGAEKHFAVVDPSRLQQVFWNLVKNAVKFTPDGGRIEVVTRDSDNGLAIDVIDNGCGFDATLQANLFNPFEQGGATVTKQYGGLGLGLSIAQTIMSLHQGTLEGHSGGPGRGARFTVCLPAQRLIPDPGHANSQPELSTIPKATPGHQLRLLVVDDNQAVLLVMQRLLSHRLGHSVTTASTSAKALHAMETAGPFDLVISDIGLPDMSGLELVGRLKELQPSLVAFACSGYGTDEDISKSLAAGFAAHLVKPVGLAVFTQMIQKYFPSTLS